MSAEPSGSHSARGLQHRFWIALICGTLSSTLLIGSYVVTVPRPYGDHAFGSARSQVSRRPRVRSLRRGEVRCLSAEVQHHVPGPPGLHTMRERQSSFGDAPVMHVTRDAQSVSHVAARDRVRTRTNAYSMTTRRLATGSVKCQVRATGRTEPDRRRRSESRHEPAGGHQRPAATSARSRLAGRTPTS
jgi:hypothetical protein